MADSDEVLALQLTCSKCQRIVKNDLPRSQIPDAFAFHDRLRAAGWAAQHHFGSNSQGQTSAERLCPKCVSSS